MEVRICMHTHAHVCRGTFGGGPSSKIIRWWHMHMFPKPKFQTPLVTKTSGHAAETKRVLHWNIKLLHKGAHRGQAQRECQKGRWGTPEGPMGHP
eukprot:scaffold174974_cov17-Tisochrysis_lutea.AAC.1